VLNCLQEFPAEDNRLQRPSDMEKSHCSGWEGLWIYAVFSERGWDRTDIKNDNESHQKTL